MMRLEYAAAFSLLVFSDCQPSDAKPAAYGAELEECTRTSQTLCASIDCENTVRPRYGRPPRELPAGCVDAGKEGGK